MKVAVGAVALVLLGAFFMFRDDKAKAVRNCMEKAGASLRESREFGRLFPYLVAASRVERVRSFPELKGATVYGVQYGTGEALLFVGRDGGAARAFERSLTQYAARGGRTLPSRRDGKVLLIWTVPPSSTSTVDSCVG